MDGTVEGFCRGCLNNFQDPTDLLQYTEESRRLFVYSTGLQVKRNDAFTFQLCKECYASMKTSCKFKKMCRASDKKIKSYLSLKDVDDDNSNMEFSTFLKRNDETIMFRLPMLSGSSTPADQNDKDDDNESTCTSIQNFMTDILKPEEIPDSEARIIREVIEEEADILEDSLDSHWLQDDISNDNDFQLNLSLSRFSTPYSTNNDRMYSSEHRELTSTDITSGEDYDNIFIDSALKKISDHVEKSEELVVDTDLQNATDVQTFVNEAKKMRCVIDKNLEKALKDENNKEFSLEALLVSPVNPNTSGASTPTIKRILFGDNIPKNKKPKSPNFETDLDLLIGKLDKGKANEGDSQSNFDIFKSNISQPQEVKLDLGNELSKGNLLDGNLEEKIDLPKLYAEKSEIDKTHLGKLLEGKLQLDMENIILGKVQESNVDLGNVNVGKSDVGKMNVDIEDFNLEKIGEVKLDLGKLSVGKFNIENLNLEEIKEHKLCSENINVGKIHDSKLDLNEISLDLLLDEKSKENNIGKEQDDIFRKPDRLRKGKLGKSGKLIHKQSQTENQVIKKNQGGNQVIKKNPGENQVIKKNQGRSIHKKIQESNAAILEEFLNAGKGKLQNVGSKEKSPSNIDNAMQIDDAELTELLQEAYDQNLESKGKKSLNVQIDKELNLNTQKSSPDKQISSPIEKKYCITNFYCKMCNKKFKDIKALKIHFSKYHQHKIRTPMKPRIHQTKVCHLCGQTFSSNRSLQHHIKNHGKPAEYKCDKCLLKFKSENALNTHKLIHRKVTEKTTVPKEIKDTDRKFICSVCGAVSTSASNHITHERRHTKEFTAYCGECGKGFYRTTDILVHMRKHTGEKPFLCTFCDQKFSRRDSLNRHLKMHTGEKLYECPYCSNKFSNPYDLHRHEVKYNKTCLKLRENET